MARLVQLKLLVVVVHLAQQGQLLAADAVEMLVFMVLAAVRQVQQALRMPMAVLAEEEPFVLFGVLVALVVPHRSRLQT
jgi:hypothetical protein